LNVRADRADLFEAAAQRIVHRDAETPRWIVAAEDLPEHIAESGIDAAGDEAGESAGPQELRSAETGAAVRRLEADVGHLLVREAAPGRGARSPRSASQVLARARASAAARPRSRAAP